MVHLDLVQVVLVMDLMLIVKVVGEVDTLNILPLVLMVVAAAVE